MAVTPKLFTELFRPQSLENVILLPRIAAELTKGLVTNTLLYGPAGCGKCLDYNETIDVYVDEETYKKIKDEVS